MTTSIRLYSIVFLAIIGLASMANGQMTGNTMATDSVATDSLQPIPESAIVDEVIWVVGDEAILKSDVDCLFQRVFLSRSMRRNTNLLGFSFRIWQS